MRPLVFVVNAASGGRSGVVLHGALARRLPPERLHRIAELPAAVERASAEPGCGLVACGGDGSAVAAMEAVRRAGLDIPVGILPLGTGNDLARVLGWGGRAPAEAEIDDRIAGLAQAGTARIDRWELEHPDGRRQAFVNYCSAGADARVALRFHRHRRRRPLLYRHTLINRASYGLFALGEPGLPGHVRLDAGDVAGAAAVLFLSVPSYAGGHRLAEGIRADDGRIDVLLLPPPRLLGMALAGLRRVRHLGAGPGIAFRLMRPTVVQLDGEPMRLPAGRYAIRHGGTVPVLVPAAGSR